jgi:hypothetical protein
MKPIVSAFLFYRNAILFPVSLTERTFPDFFLVAERKKGKGE